MTANDCRIQTRGMAPPRYTETGRTGPNHAPVFTSAVERDTAETDSTTACSKRQAEQAAARALLDRLEGLRVVDPTLVRRGRLPDLRPCSHAASCTNGRSCEAALRRRHDWWMAGLGRLQQLNSFAQLLRVHVYVALRG